jgi:rhodanese-related sulfurtransferase
MESMARQMMVDYTSKFSVPVITSDEIKELQKSNANILLVDVRDQEERNVSMIPGAISKDRFEKALDSSQIDKNTMIIPYCTIGHWSGVYGSKLMERGWENVKNGEGIVLWTYTGPNALVTTNARGDKCECNAVHTYGAQWNLIESTYEPVFYSSARLLADATKRCLSL